MKTCPFCAEDIQDAAIVCKHCGRDLATGHVSGKTVIVQQQSQPAWSPGIAAILSLVIPGAGQMYKGQVANGIVWLIVVVMGYVAFIVPGLFLHLCCIIGASMGNPNPAAKKDDLEISPERKAEIDATAQQRGAAAAKIVARSGVSPVFLMFCAIAVLLAAIILWNQR